MMQVSASPTAAWNPRWRAPRSPRPECLLLRAFTASRSLDFLPAGQPELLRLHFVSPPTRNQPAHAPLK